MSNALLCRLVFHLPLFKSHPFHRLTRFCWGIQKSPLALFNWKHFIYLFMLLEKDKLRGLSISISRACFTQVALSWRSFLMPIYLRCFLHVTSLTIGTNHTGWVDKEIIKDPVEPRFFHVTVNSYHVNERWTVIWPGRDVTRLLR